MDIIVKNDMQLEYLLALHVHRNWKDGSNYFCQTSISYSNSNDDDNNNNECPGYNIKLHPVAEFQSGIMRLPFGATTFRSSLSKV